MAAALFFRGTGSGEELPYIKEFLWCYETGWTWDDLQGTPKPVMDYFQVYRGQYVAEMNRRTEQS